MKTISAIVGVAAVSGALLASAAARAQESDMNSQPREIQLNVGTAALYVRSVGEGPAVIVLHGGPDFDTGYLLPELEQLGNRFHLISYDQRGRGKSAESVEPEEVTIASEMNDLDAVRRHFGLEAPALLGHSWGAVLALEYAIRHPSHVSGLVLMNPSPVSAADFALSREVYVKKLGDDMERQTTILDSAAYLSGDPDAVAARYWIHFKPAIMRSEHLAAVMAKMEARFQSQGSDGILKAWAVEDRLMQETWLRPDYDLLPKARNLSVPTLVLMGDHDFFPAEVAQHVAEAIPNAKLVTLEDCGHFSYLECPRQVSEALEKFFR